MRYFFLLFLFLLPFYNANVYAQSSLHAQNVKAIMNGRLHGNGLTQGQRSNIEKAIREQVEAQRKAKESAKIESDRNARLFQKWEKNNQEASFRLTENTVFANDRVQNMSGAVRSGAYAQIPNTELMEQQYEQGSTEDNKYAHLIDVLNNAAEKEKIESEASLEGETQLTFVPLEDSPVVPTSSMSARDRMINLTNLQNSEDGEDFWQYTNAPSYTPINISAYEDFRLQEIETQSSNDSIQILVLDSVVVSKLDNYVFSIDSNDLIETLLTTDTDNLRLYPNNGTSFFIVVNSKAASCLLIYQLDDKTYQEIIRLPHEIDNIAVVDNHVLLLVRQEIYELDDELQLSHIIIK